MSDRLFTFEEIRDAMIEKLDRIDLPHDASREKAISLIEQLAGVSGQVEKTDVTDWDGAQPEIVVERPGNDLRHIDVKTEAIDIIGSTGVAVVVGLLTGPVGGAITIGVTYFMRKAAKAAFLPNLGKLSDLDAAVFSALFTLQHPDPNSMERAEAPNTEAVMNRANASLPNDLKFTEVRDVHVRLKALADLGIVKETDDSQEGARRWVVIDDYIRLNI